MLCFGCTVAILTICLQSSDVDFWLYHPEESIGIQNLNERICMPKDIHCIYSYGQKSCRVKSPDTIYATHYVSLHSFSSSGRTDLKKYPNSPSWSTDSKNVNTIFVGSG